MKIKKGDKITVNHRRKGIFDAIAENDFDTDIDEFFDVYLDQDSLEGQVTDWYRGCNIPCRKDLCTITKRK